MINWRRKEKTILVSRLTWVFLLPAALRDSPDIPFRLFAVSRVLSPLFVLGRRLSLAIFVYYLVYMDRWMCVEEYILGVCFGTLIRFSAFDMCFIHSLTRTNKNRSRGGPIGYNSQPQTSVKKDGFSLDSTPCRDRHTNTSHGKATRNNSKDKEVGTMNGECSKRNLCWDRVINQDIRENPSNAGERTHKRKDP